VQEVAASEDERSDAARLDELRQILSTLIHKGDLTFTTTTAAAAAAGVVGSSDNGGSALDKWNIWLRKQHTVTVSQLIVCIRKGRRTAVRTLWGLLAASPIMVTTPTTTTRYVHATLLYQWLSAVVGMPATIDVRHDKGLRHMLESELMQRDVQYYTLKSIARWATERYHQNKQQQQQQQQRDNKEDLSEQADRMLCILMMIPFATTQAALDMPSNKYMFPPSEEGPSRQNGSYADADADADADANEEDSDNENDEASNSSDDDDDDDADDNDNNDNGPPTKKQRLAAVKQLSYQDVKCHLEALAKVWLAILRLPISTTSLKKALDLFIKAYRGATGNNDSDDATATATTAASANTQRPDSDDDDACVGNTVTL